MFAALVVSLPERARARLRLSIGTCTFTGWSFIGKTSSKSSVDLDPLKTERDRHRNRPVNASET